MSDSQIETSSKSVPLHSLLIKSAQRQEEVDRRKHANDPQGCVEDELSLALRLCCFLGGHGGRESFEKS